MSTSHVAETARGATYLILLQVGSRLVTFALNQLLIRYMSPVLLGASTQLELYAISVLYFARESLRVALQRHPSSKRDAYQIVVNMAYLAIALGMPLSAGLGVLYLRTCPKDVTFLRESLYVYGVAVLLELCAEPAFAVAQHGMQYGIRASAETGATVARCVTTLGVAAWASWRQSDIGVLPFAAGQLSYATALLVMYLVRTKSYAKGKGFSLSLSPVQTKYVAAVTLLNQVRPLIGFCRNRSEYMYSYFSTLLLQLTLSLSLQSAVKYILTQGDSIIITSLATLSEQGSYALASNYGSLVARMLFQPIEETSRNLFSKLNSRDGDTNPSPAQQKGGLPSTGILQAREVLQDILKLYGLISLLAVTVGPVLAPILLRIVAGSKWADSGAAEVLSKYCYYIPLLAINGVTEAFVSAVANTKELRNQSVYMGVFFAGFAASAFVFLRVLDLKASGLIFANCVNMMLRISWSFSFIYKYFGEKGHVCITNYEHLCCIYARFL